MGQEILPAVADGSPKAIFLIGAPGSGKTTWREQYASHAAVRATVVISSDDMIEAWAVEQGLSHADAFSKVSFSRIDAEMEKLVQRAVAGNADLIIDRTNMKRRSRNQFHRQIPDTYRREAVVFDVPLAELSRRLQARAETTGKLIPEDVVAGMLAAYAAPGLDEFHSIEYA